MIPSTLKIKDYLIFLSFYVFYANTENIENIENYFSNIAWQEFSTKS